MENLRISKNLLPNNCADFDKLIETENKCLIGIRFIDNNLPKITVKQAQSDYSKSQHLNIQVNPENRDIDVIVIIIRSSPNYYSVIGYERKDNELNIERCQSIKEINELLIRKYVKQKII